MLQTDDINYWRITHLQWALFCLTLVLAVATCIDAVTIIVGYWFGSEEYSHASFIPIIVIFLIWQKKAELGMPIIGSWLGVAVLVLGSLLYFAGDLSSLLIICQYSFLIILFGLILALAGSNLFKQIWVPLAFLFFTIPLPDFLFQALSAKLRLWSSVLGVYFIRLFDISVYLEGNVIDLGSSQLQVAEACSGLNYLFPLVSVAFICAYFFKAPLWQRGIVFFSSIPITIFMNSFRIGMIGVLTDRFGKSMAEGFLHDFEGWFVFMVCTGILIAEMWAFARFGREQKPLMEVFGLTMPDPLPASTVFHDTKTPNQYYAVLLILSVALALSLFMEKRQEVVPTRAEFIEFPMKLGEWQGRRQVMEKIYTDQLKFTDYILADFARKNGGSAVNFYSAYYASQRKGASVHSPRTCLPGGGWVINSLTTEKIDDALVSGKPLNFNRVLIDKGEDRQLVYYWFQQRGRILTNEYLVKWFLLWDALTMNRTDGALVRLTTLVQRTEDINQADQRLKDFLKLMQPQLDQFVPN